MKFNWFKKIINTKIYDHKHINEDVHKFDATKITKPTILDIESSKKAIQIHFSTQCELIIKNIGRTLTLFNGPTSLTVNSSEKYCEIHINEEKIEFKNFTEINTTARTNNNDKIPNLKYHGKNKSKLTLNIRSQKVDFIELNKLEANIECEENTFIDNLIIKDTTWNCKNKFKISKYTVTSSRINTYIGDELEFCNFKNKVKKIIKDRNGLYVCGINEKSGEAYLKHSGKARFFRVKKLKHLLLQPHRDLDLNINKSKINIISEVSSPSYGGFIIKKLNLKASNFDLVEFKKDLTCEEINVYKCKFKESLYFNKVIQIENINFDETIFNGSTDKSKNSYHFLKKLCNRAGKPADAVKFEGLERSVRIKNTYGLSSFTGILSLIYSSVFKNGDSVGRPAVVLFILISFNTYFYWLFSAYKWIHLNETLYLGLKSYVPVISVFLLALLKAIPIIFSFENAKKLYVICNNNVVLFDIFMGLLYVLVWFLLFLSVRRKFKINT